MSERVEQIYRDLKDVPTNERPFLRSFLTAAIAAHYERGHDKRSQEVAGIAWLANKLLLEEAIQKDPEGTFSGAVLLATLPKKEDEDEEWYRRWVSTNGLMVLQDELMRERLIKCLDDPKKGRDLANVLDSILSTNVDGLDIDGLSDTPEAFSLFATFLVCFNFYTPEMEGVREKLFEKAINRLLAYEANSETNRVMDLFGEIEDTKEMYERFKNARNWYTY